MGGIRMGNLDKCTFVMYQSWPLTYLAGKMLRVC